MRALAGPDADLEDLVQEVFIAVHRSRASFRGDSARTTWLFGITANRPASEIAELYGVTPSVVWVWLHRAPVEVAVPLPVPVAVPPVEVEDPLLAESRLLARAVAELREQHDAHAALRTLDEYSQRFANGVLRNEAALTRVEALVAASERKQALTLLESLDLTVTPRGSELRVLRGEFLLEDGRRDAARTDFEQALTGRLVRDVEERALFGLANAPSDEQLARQAFQRYLERFPEGRFAAQAREHLESSP